jgi:hypothetical protein
MKRYSFAYATSALGEKYKRTHNTSEMLRRISKANRAFYRRQVKDLLKKNTWEYTKIAEWVNNPRPELDGMTPVEALKNIHPRKPYARRTFELLVQDMGLNLKEVKESIKPSKVSVEY